MRGTPQVLAMTFKFQNSNQLKSSFSVNTKEPDSLGGGGGWNNGEGARCKVGRSYPTRFTGTQPGRRKSAVEVDDRWYRCLGAHSATVGQGC